MRPRAGSDRIARASPCAAVKTNEQHAIIARRLAVIGLAFEKHIAVRAVATAIPARRLSGPNADGNRRVGPDCGLVVIIICTVKRWSARPRHNERGPLRDAVR